MKLLNVAQSYFLKCTKYMDYAMDSTEFREAIPSTTIKCCRFQVNMGQAWWRKIQTIGLDSHYKDNHSGPFADYLLENYVFTLTLTNSSTHLIPPFSYLTSCI